MIFLDITMALAVALLLSAVFVASTRRGNKKTGLIWLFLIIFLATWAGGIWLRPFGSRMLSTHWLGFLFVGMIVVLFLLINIRTNNSPRGRQETLDMLENIRQEKEVQNITYITLSIFFWVLLIALVLAIIVRYVFVI